MRARSLRHKHNPIFTSQSEKFKPTEYSDKNFLMNITRCISCDMRAQSESVALPVIHIQILALRFH